MEMNQGNSYSTKKTLQYGNSKFSYHSLAELNRSTGGKVSRLPYSLRVLLENLLRFEDGDIVKRGDIEALLNWVPQESSTYEIQFTPARVLLQDFTGVPVIADLAAMRSAFAARGGDPRKINPLRPVDLVIDHSVQVDAFGSSAAFETNARFDFKRNMERYEFLKWGQRAFNNFQVVPPATGICHQVNLEYLAQVAMCSTESDGQDWIYFDTLVGTDSHTPMVNGLGVLGWGVGGIEAEAAMLGQPCSMLIPDVVGVSLTGALAPGVTATDLVLTLTQKLRKANVVGKFVEYFGPGVAGLEVADRATISNMAPEYGATVGFWPVDAKTISYLHLTNRSKRAELTELYFREQELFAESSHSSCHYSSIVELDLSSVEASVAGPSRPHDRAPLGQVGANFRKLMAEKPVADRSQMNTAHKPELLRDGSIVIAAITSCTNTSNPQLMVGAALLARNAVAKGLKPAPWVKTSFAPGSKAVTAYLQDAHLMSSLDDLGFQLVGYGCTTCIGNSGPLSVEVSREIEERNLTVAAVLSGNRNFEARIHPLVRANYLASPPLVVAFALAGRIDVDLTSESLGVDSNGQPVYLKDIWPSREEVAEKVQNHVTAKRFSESYGGIFNGDHQWQQIPVSEQAGYDWKSDSSYIKKPPFLDPEWNPEVKEAAQTVAVPAKEIRSARILGLFSDFITTDHISPAGSIGEKTPAGQYLQQLGVKIADFNSYGSRRGNHDVMVRGTFANVRLRNLLVEQEGGFTRHFPDGAEMTIFDACMKYKVEDTPLVIIAGREYGSGSSRDWAAKGTRLLGVKAVLARSFERIHRSNLVGMGVLPLEFIETESTPLPEFKGDEQISVLQIEKILPKSLVEVEVKTASGEVSKYRLRCRIDTPNELRYFQSGGILPYMLSRLAR
jgi:aconitate hydratase